MNFKSALAIAFVLLLFGCDKMERKEDVTSVSRSVAKPEELKPPSELDAAKDNALQHSANRNGETERKFIRTADIKFKVKNVINTTAQIEDVTKQMGGFVANTDLKSHIESTNTVAVSADSSLESSYYSVSNELVLRVPDAKLDSTLKVLSTMVDFLDSRNIKADDVHLQLLGNRWAQQRAIHHISRLSTAIDTKGKKLNETTGAEESITESQAMADNSRLANLNLEDQINYSTISLQIYERQTIKRELIANNKDIRAYQPGLATRAADAFKSGWAMFESLLIMLVQLWWLVLLALIAWLIVTKLLPKYKLYKQMAG